MLMGPWWHNADCSPDTKESPWKETPSYGNRCSWSPAPVSISQVEFTRNASSVLIRSVVAQGGPYTAVTSKSIYTIVFVLLSMPQIEVAMVSFHLFRNLLLFLQMFFTNPTTVPSTLLFDIKDIGRGHYYDKRPVNNVVVERGGWSGDRLSQNNSLGKKYW